jgi:signal transduction histidine kinase
MTLAREARKHGKLSDFLPIVHRELNRVMDAQWFYLALYDKKAHKYSFPYHVDKYDDLQPDQWIELPSSSLTDFVRRSDKGHRVTKANRKRLTQNDIPIGRPAAIWMGAPLKNTDQESFGAICVQNYEDADAYDIDDLNILEFAGIQIGMILENLEREKELIESRSQAVSAADQIRQLYHLGVKQQEVMASLLQGAKIILAYPDFKESGERLFAKCKSLTGADCGFIVSVDANQMMSAIVVTDFGKQESRIGTEVPLMVSGFREEVIRTRQTILENDFSNSTSIKLLPPGHIDLQNLLIAPMIYNAQVVGLLGLANKSGGFNSEDMSIAEAYAELISLASFNSNNLLELEKARVRAEESDRLKSAFISNMSHEIRTPLNGILGFSELLKEPDIAPEERNNYIRIINGNGEQLISIINNILDISMIESGQIKMVYEWVPVAHIMQEVNELFLSPGLRKPDVQYILDCDASLMKTMIYTDAGRLRQILVNLFGNATKFTRYGHVLLGCRIQKGEHGDEISFFVEDTGPGIARESLDRIFERFLKADTDMTRKVSGTGLGLAISKGLTEMLGGRIEVQSTPNIGSIFRVIFPHQKT